MFPTSTAVDRVARGSLRPKLAAPQGDTVSLAVGEPDFDTPEPIVEAAAEALRSGATHYADQHGDPELRQLLAERVSDIAGQTFGTEQLLVTHGATGALAAAILGTVDPGDRVVIPEPCYSLYPDLVRIAGAEPVLVPCDDQLRWDMDALRAALPGARMLVFSNPANPTGIVLREDELRAIAEELEGTETLVLADEAYDAIVYEPDRFRSALAIDGLRERTVYAQTFSKAYAMTGWRIGYLAGPAEVIAAAGRVHRTCNGSVNTAVQRAALTALRRDAELRAPMLEQYRKRRAVFFERLAEIPELHAEQPAGTFYVFASYTPELSANELTARLADAGVLVRSGSEYGPSGAGHIRFSFATDIERIHTAMDRVARCLGELASA